MALDPVVMFFIAGFVISLMRVDLTELMLLPLQLTMVLFR